MPTTEIEKPRPLCPTGPATFRLKSVEAKEFQSYSGDGMTTRWIWSFVSNRRTPEGEFYEVSIFTGQKYGNSKAKLTWLYDMLWPGITPKQAEGLNTEVFVGRDYEGSVKHASAEKDPTQKVATFIYLRPVGAPADPFVDGDAGAVALCEVCEQELTSAEDAACAKRWEDRHRFCTHHAKEKIALEKIEAAEAEDLFADA